MLNRISATVWEYNEYSAKDLQRTGKSCSATAAETVLQLHLAEGICLVMKQKLMKKPKKYNKFKYILNYKNIIKKIIISLKTKYNMCFKYFYYLRIIDYYHNPQPLLCFQNFCIFSKNSLAKLKFILNKGEKI